MPWGTVILKCTDIKDSRVYSEPLLIFHQDMFYFSTAYAAETKPEGFHLDGYRRGKLNVCKSSRHLEERASRAVSSDTPGLTHIKQFNLPKVFFQGNP